MLERVGRAVRGTMEGMRKLGSRKLIAVAAAAVLAGGVAGALLAWPALDAAQEADVGWVDVTRLTEEYLRPVLEQPLAQETSRLQAEFDERSKNLKDEEKRTLFQEYQARLDRYKQEMIDQHLPVIDAAIERVAREQNLQIVLESQAVLYGGIDITDQVLKVLRETAARGGGGGGRTGGGG